MAEQDAIGGIFRDLTVQLANVSAAVGTQSIAQIVPAFSGNSKEFRAWIKAIEKYAMLTELGDDKKKLVAYQSSSGSVSDFIQRYLRENRNHTWEQLRTELSSRFAEITDPQHAFMLLRSVRQQPNENVQIYAERLLSLAQEAFVNPQQQDLAAVERQIIGFFIDGLSHDYLKLKVMRENPVNFAAAVTSAMNEQNLRSRFDLRTGKNYTSDGYEHEHEKMDIDHIRPARRCKNCNRRGHIERDCRLRQINAVEQQDRSTGRNTRCYECNELGHIARNCPRARNERKCFNCGAVGHFWRECTTRTVRNRNGNVQKNM